jgi:hypothetical protein
MKLFDRRLAPVLLFALSACGGAGSVAPAPPGVMPNQPSAQGESRQIRSEHGSDEHGSEHGSKKPRTYAGTINDLVPPCGQPSYSCTGKFAVALTVVSGVVSGTWTEDFTNPTLHDGGTFIGVTTSPTTFTATFSSPADAPCTIDVSGTLTDERIDAVYRFITNRGCPVVDNGTINLRHGEGDDGRDRDRDRDHGEGHHGDD